MSTRSYICVAQDDGTIKGVYCHFDGYLTYNGALLLDNYSTRGNAQKIIDLGNVSILDERLFPSHTVPHEFGNREEGVSLFYGRDDGRDDQEAQRINLEELNKDGAIEFTYIHDGERWKYFEHSKLDEGLRDVEEDLNAYWRENGFDERPRGVYGDFLSSDFKRLKIELGMEEPAVSDNKKSKNKNGYTVWEDKNGNQFTSVEVQKMAMGEMPIVNEKITKNPDETAKTDSKPAPTSVSQQKKSGWDRVKENRQELIDYIHGEISKGNLDWQHYLTGRAVPHNGDSGRQYHGLNRLYLTVSAMKQGFEDPRWYTFNQVKNMGLSVEKGSKGTRIEKFTVWDTRTKREIHNRKEFEELTKGMSEDEKKAYKEENIKTYVNQHIVFNGQQVKGLEKYTLSKLNEDEKNECCEHVLEHSFVPIIYDANAIDAAYDRVSDNVILPSRERFVSMDDFYSTAFHEIAHATGSGERLDRPDGAFGSAAYAVEEVTAELSSLFLQQDLGAELKRDVVKNSAAYIQNWEKVLSKPEEFFHAVSAAQKAAAYIEEHTAVKANEESKEPQEANDSAISEEKTNSQGKPLVVNFYAGPGAGKTTAALELTAALKKAGYNVEYVSEYAKELVLEGKADKLADQRLVTDEQFHRLDRLRDSVDVIVTDSPVLLGQVYGEGRIDEAYKAQIRSYYDSFDNFNVMVSRGKEYQQEGRIQSADEAKALDGKIEAMLAANKVYYGRYNRGEIDKTVERIETTYKRLHPDNANAGIERKEEDRKEYGVKTNRKDNLSLQSQGKSLLSPREYYAQKNSKRLEEIERNVPAEMKALPNWCAFKTYYDKDNGKKKKIILSPETGQWGKCNDPATWTSYENAMDFARKNNCEGLSFALEPRTRIGCVDLDHCINDNGMRSELCWNVLNASGGTYAEKSVSGHGVHVFFKADGIVDGYNKKDDAKGLECYDCSKFISVTGNSIGKTNDVKEAPKKLVELLHAELGKSAATSNTFAGFGSSRLSDSDLIEKIRSSKVGADFERMMNGEDICGDHSRTDAKLMSTLAFFSDCDPVQMKSVFKESGLYRPDKGEKYIDRTIDFVTSTLTTRPTHLGGKFAGRSAGHGGKTQAKDGGKGK